MPYGLELSFNKLISDTWPNLDQDPWYMYNMLSLGLNGLILSHLIAQYELYHVCGAK